MMDGSIYRNSMLLPGLNQLITLYYYHETTNKRKLVDNNHFQYTDEWYTVVQDLQT